MSYMVKKVRRDLMIVEEERQLLPEESKVYGERRNHVDELKMYLREIGRIPMLTIAEEQFRGIQLSGANCLMESATAALRNPAIDEETISKLQKEYIEAKLLADQAQHRLAEGNLKLVVYVAKKYLRRGLSLLELIQEGNIGLFRAAAKFDVSMENKFSTYAHQWIQQGITRAIANQARTIRLPVHILELVNRYIKTEMFLTQALGREPFLSEIAKAMNITEEAAENIYHAAQNSASLDVPIDNGEEESHLLGDLVPDKEQLPVFETAAQTLLKDQINNVLADFLPRERRVLELRFGLNGGWPQSLEEIGKEFNVSRERIRQIETEALEKLRHSQYAPHLKEYLYY